MADITQIQVGSTTYDIRDGKHATYHVKGTQESSTNSWTGNLSEVESLYEGLTIDYWLPFAGTSSSATLTLTLKDGTQTEAVPVYRNGTTRMTTQIAANNFLHLVYQTITISGTSYTGWWMHADANTNTTDIVNLYQGSGAYQANSAVYRYQLLFQIDNNILTPLNNKSNATGTTKTMLTNVEFDPFGYIFYYNSTTAISAGGNMTTALFYQRNSVDLRYTFNCGSTLTAHEYIYLKLILQSNGKVKISTDPCWTQTLPETNDGYLYLLLGRTYSTYQFALFKEHPIYYHDGTSLRKLENIDLVTQSNSGLMSPSDKSKLDGIESNANNYNLPIASSTVLGGIKIGSNLNIDSNGVLSSDNATVWGSISGTLNSQTDLKAALDAKSFTTHSHGSLYYNGQVTGGNPIADGDYVLIGDASNNNRLCFGSTAKFDGSTTTQALTKKGTFEEFSIPGHTHSWGSITGSLTTQIDLQNALNLKADLNSPALTGAPTAPTATISTSTTQIATTGFIKQLLSTIISVSSETLYITI